MFKFVELNNDQRRETVNTRQRFDAWRNALHREQGYRGSMTWTQVNGTTYLVRSYYDERNIRRQKSLGARTPETTRTKERFDAERENAISARKVAESNLGRQAAINRVLGLGRVPLTAARILRALDRRGLMGNAIRVAGTHALYAYEAACGVLVDAEITATGDVDLLFDARRRLFLIADEALETDTLLELLRKADKTFARASQTFRALNEEGYLVDLIKPRRAPPWTKERQSIGGSEDLQAAEIEGLVWLENAPPFEAVAIDEKGQPLRIVAPDPRIFAIHKQWISTRADRDPLKKARDAEQARVVAELVARYLPHLPFERPALTVVPGKIVDAFLDARPG